MKNYTKMDPVGVPNISVRYKNKNYMSMRLRLQSLSIKLPMEPQKPSSV